MPELTIVVPVYYNEENLPDLVPALERATTGMDVEFVFVDDGSGDGSWRWLERWAVGEPRATAVKLSRNFGSFTACTAGLAHARGDAAIIISADLQDPPELIPEMVAHWRQGTSRWPSRNRRRTGQHQRLAAILVSCAAGRCATCRPAVRFLPPSTGR
jgi:glycosyltransferase involved in cell wall biosynthesis